jgi:DNA-binding NtrC family response regulator
MKESISALLVQARHDPLDPLRMALEEQSIAVLTARNCAEAALALWSQLPPHLVFTEIQLADGGWTDVLTLSMKASAPVNVIVVSSFVDVGLYVEAIQRGAFDFIVPPHSDPELLHVVRIAAENAFSRRRKHAATMPPLPFGGTQPGNIQRGHAVTGADD